MLTLAGPAARAQVVDIDKDGNIKTSEPAQISAGTTGSSQRIVIPLAAPAGLQLPSRMNISRGNVKEFDA